MERNLTTGVIIPMLDALFAAACAEGIAIISLNASQNAKPEAPLTLCEVGAGLPATAGTASHLLRRGSRGPSRGTGPDGRPVLVCPCLLPPDRPGALVMWRKPGARAWDQRDEPLAAAGAEIAGILLDHRARVEAAGQDMIDPLTGLPSRGLFAAQAERLIERLDRDGTPGTLVLVDLDKLKQLNDALGRAAGDAVLRQAAARLRSLVRPTDLVARTGGDEFALWLNGMDHLTAAERAESLRLQPLVPPASSGQAGAPVQTMSVGIATRWPGRSETFPSLLDRARKAIYQVKCDGGAHWIVATEQMS